MINTSKTFRTHKDHRSWAKWCSNIYCRARIFLL